MVMIKLKTPLVCILAVLTLPLLGTVASATTVTVLETFDFPNIPVATSGTLPQKISDQGDIIGTVIDVTGAAQGFILRFRALKFSAAFHAPGDTGHLTQGRSINNQRHSCGEYVNGSDGTFHGYKLLHPSFVDFDVANTLDTIPLGINNAGSLVGTVILSDGTQPGFLFLRGKTTTFEVPGATATFAYQLNTSNQIIGYYIDASGITHGFTRDSAGNLTFPIDAPGSTGTILFGNNDSNYGVGRYTDASGVTHGLFFITADNILTFDYPGSTYTSLNGINKLGMICGYYLDAAGVAHGFTARLSSGVGGKPNTDIPLLPVKPAYQTPEMSGNAAPAL